MNRFFPWRTLTAAFAVTALAGCGDLEITNPNAPDADRALSDPATIAAVVGGTLKSWWETRQSFSHGLHLATMGDAHSGSWNNFNLRYYSSYGKECPNRCGWVNATTSSYYEQIELAYYGYYAALSSANDGVIAIRNNGVTIPGQTKMIETIGVMMQGLAMAGIALNYDRGFVVDENTDLSKPTELPIATREELRDAAIAKFNDAHALATANSFNTPASWTGKTQGTSYSNVQVAKIIRTMQAHTLANYARNGAEAGQVNWGQVAQYASQGIDFDFKFYVDVDWDFLDRQKLWGNSDWTMRVDSRLTSLIPGSNQRDPYVSPDPLPNSPDKRMGDGTWGPEDNVSGTNTVKATANAGTDFAWNGRIIFPAVRGLEHQSNIHHSRYSWLAYEGEGLPGETSSGPAPTMSKATNDLLWAEALIRSGGSKAQAAALINNTRVGRGGLVARNGGESNATLLQDVVYESLIENLGLGPDAFYLRRRFDQLWPDTPRQYPIPAKELQLLGLELYTFGGPGKPDMIPAELEAKYGKVKNVKEIWAELNAAEKAAARKGAGRLF